MEEVHPMSDTDDPWSSDRDGVETAGQVPDATREVWGMIPVMTRRYW